MLASLLAGFLAASPLPILHLRADTGLVLDSKGTLARWLDLSPRGARFTAPDSSRRPTPTASGLQGLPSIRFDGAHVLADSSALPLDSGFTVFFVAQDLHPSGNSAFLNKGPDDLSVDLWGQDVGNFQISHAWVKTIAKTDFQTSSAMLYAATWNRSVARLFIAGRMEAEGAYESRVTRNPVTWIAGAFAHGSWQGFFTGHIGEILVFAGELDDSTRIRIESELLARWDLDRLGTWSRGTPKDAGAPLMLHLRADTGLVLDRGGAVARWQDLSPRRMDFIQPDSLGRPTPAGNWNATGRRSVRFGGKHALYDTTSLPLDSAFTLLFVAQDSNPNNYTAILNKGRNDMSVDLWGGDAGNFQISHAWVQTIARTSFQTSRPVLYEATWSGSQARLFASGQPLATGTYTGIPTRAQRTTLGAVLNGSRLEGFLTGHIAEVRLYRGVLADSLRVVVEDSLAATWRLDPQDVSISGRRPAGIRDFQLVAHASGWTVLSPAGITATLLTPDGSVLGRARFRDGQAALPRAQGVAIVRVVGRSGTAVRLVGDLH